MHNNKNEHNAIEHLVYLFSKLPGLGPRSARRIVLYLLNDRHIRMNLLASALSEAAVKITECEECFNLDHSSPCQVCANVNRDPNIIAVVESVADLWAIERSNNFNGKYHVLGSTLSAVNQRTPENLKLLQLKRRCIENNVRELIIATNSTLEGQTTAYYITEFFKDSNITISRLASGIPMGGELDYLDEGTLTAAFNLRQPF